MHISLPPSGTYAFQECHGARTSHEPAAPAPPPPPPVAAEAEARPPARSAFRLRSPSSSSSPEEAAPGDAAARHFPRRQEGQGGWSWAGPAGPTLDRKGAQRVEGGGPDQSWGRKPKAVTRRRRGTGSPCA